MKKKHILAALVCAFMLSGCSSDAVDNHKQGLALFNQGKYDQAAQYFLKSVAENNGAGSYYVDLGMNYIKLSDYTNAKDAFDHAISLKDSDELAYRGIGIMYYEQGKYDEAIEYFNKAIDEVELSVGELETDILEYRGEAEFGAKSYEAAAKTFDTLVKLGVDVSDNNLKAGRANLYMGQEKLAADYFDKALNAASDKVMAYFFIYNAYKECSLMDKGHEFLNRALEVEGTSSLDHLNRGKIYYILGNYPAAITELSYPLADNDPEAALYCAFCYEEQEDYAKACELYLKSLEIKNDPVTANYYACCLSKNGDNNHAWNVVHTAMENFPDCEIMQELKWNEIILYEKLEMYPSALARLQEYQKAYPDDTQIEAELSFLILKQNISGDNSND